jgi:hypothetical protein
MQISQERQAWLARRARDVGALAPRFAALLVGYAAVVALYSRESMPRWVVVIGAAGGFVILLSYLLMLWQASPSALPARPHESGALLDRIPGWHRLDDVALPGLDVDHVVATPHGLLVVENGWQSAGRAANAARRIRRLTSLPPNGLTVPVRAAVLAYAPGGGVPRCGWDDGSGAYVLDAHRPWTWPGELTDPCWPAFDASPGEVEEALRKVGGWVTHHERRVALTRVVLMVLTEVVHGLANRRPLIVLRVPRAAQPLVRA